jgi:hypothetical protein
MKFVGDSILPRNAGIHLPGYTVPQSKKLKYELDGCG